MALLAWTVADTIGITTFAHPHARRSIQPGAQKKPRWTASAALILKQYQ